MSRTARLLSMITGVLALIAFSATAASAQVPSPDGGGPDAPITIVTHTVPGPGLAPWVVLLIAVIAVAVGAGLTELVHVARRDTHPRQLATA